MPIFPPPKFLTMPAVGFDISADALRFIELKEDHGGLVVSRYATRNFPLGIIADGHVREKKKLQDAIASMAKEYKLGFANIALPEEQAYLANIHLPTLAPSEIRGAIELRLEEYVPISGAEAIFDYVVIDQQGKRRDGLDIVVSVLPRSAVDEYLEIFRGTGITPKTFEFESQAMARAVIPEGDNGTFMVVDIGKMITGVFVVASGVVQFSASLDIGGHHLTQAIERALKLRYEEAETIKIVHGLVGGEKVAEAHGAILPAVSDLRTRLMRHYAYWQTHHGEKIGGNIEAVFLTGGGANLRGLTEYIAMGLEAKVRLANPWTNVCSFDRYIPPIPQHESLGYTAAIGLALRNSFSV